MTIETFIDVVLLGFLGVTAIAVVRVKNLFAAVMLTGIYSLLSAAIFLCRGDADAPEAVAFPAGTLGVAIIRCVLYHGVRTVGRQQRVRV